MPFLFDLIEAQIWIGFLLFKLCQDKRWPAPPDGNRSARSMARSWQVPSGIQEEEIKIFIPWRRFAFFSLLSALCGNTGFLLRNTGSNPKAWWNCFECFLKKKCWGNSRFARIWRQSRDVEMPKVIKLVSYWRAPLAGLEIKHTEHEEFLFRFFSSELDNNPKQKHFSRWNQQRYRFSTVAVWLQLLQYCCWPGLHQLCDS